MIRLEQFINEGLYTVAEGMPFDRFLERLASLADKRGLNAGYLEERNMPVYQRYSVKRLKPSRLQGIDHGVIDAKGIRFMWRNTNENICRMTVTACWNLDMEDKVAVQMWYDDKETDRQPAGMGAPLYMCAAGAVYACTDTLLDAFGKTLETVETDA
jgi:hypothetical protein